LVDATAVIASPPHFQASSRWPTSAYAIAKYDDHIGVVMRKSSGALHLTDDWEQRAIGVLR
jgi:hypothetical protein